MASLTFGSVGDIISICDILRHVVQALSESRGSAAEYQALIRELQALSQAVSSTRLLLEKYPQLKENDRLRALLKDCRDNLVQELEHIRPYRTALQAKPTAGAVKAISRKIRWLAGKDERAIFRAAIASHVLALSAVLTISGVDSQYQFYSSTVDQLQQGFGELKLVSDQSDIAYEAQTVRMENSVQESKTILAARHDHSDEQALARHAEINRKLDALHSTVLEHQGQKNHQIATINPSNAQNRAYLMLIVKLLKELASMGLIGAYHFLQVIQLMISYRALHFFPQSTYLLVEDAIFRQFAIDVDFMSYQTFTKLIEDKFASTPGASVVALKGYFFEDKKRQRLGLEGVWSSDILKGRKVFMRATIKTGSISRGSCPACGVANEKVNADKEITCVCGCKYTTSLIISAEPASDAARVFPGVHRQSAKRAHDRNEAAKFFKRVDRVLERTFPLEWTLPPQLHRQGSFEPGESFRGSSGRNSQEGPMRSHSKANQKYSADPGREFLRRFFTAETEEENDEVNDEETMKEQTIADSKLAEEERREDIEERRWAAEEQENSRSRREYMLQRLRRDGYTEEELRMITAESSPGATSREVADEQTIQLRSPTQGSGDNEKTLSEEVRLNLIDWASRPRATELRPLPEYRHQHRQNQARS